MTNLQKAAKAMIEHSSEFYAHYKRAVTSGCIPLSELRFVAAQKDLRKALDAELAQSVEPVAWLRNDDFKAMVNGEKESWIESGNADVVEDYDKPLYLHQPQPQATTPAVPEGYALVPIEPTIGMMSQMPASSNSQEWKEYYSAMLEVAQGEIK